MHVPAGSSPSPRAAPPVHARVATAQLRALRTSTEPARNQHASNALWDPGGRVWAELALCAPGWHQCCRASGCRERGSCNGEGGVRPSLRATKLSDVASEGFREGRSGSRAPAAWAPSWRSRTCRRAASPRRPGQAAVSPPLDPWGKEPKHRQVTWVVQGHRASAWWNKTGPTAHRDTSQAPSPSKAPERTHTAQRRTVPKGEGPGDHLLIILQDAPLATNAVTE